jgi:2-amino-4-hydroxy-6-hydroxymethyldihydropteridine diphosphokinase
MISNLPRIAFGLGSNMGNSEALLEKACHYLNQQPFLKPDSLHASSLYRNPALLPEGAPADWNREFMNQVIVGTLNQPITETLAYVILRACKTIEQQLGRQDRGHWSPREIDIDIIAIEGFCLTSATLTIPHAQAHQRDFVLLPLKEVWHDCAIFSASQAPSFTLS